MMTLDTFAASLAESLGFVQVAEREDGLGKLYKPEPRQPMTGIRTEATHFVVWFGHGSGELTVRVHEPKLLGEPSFVASVSGPIPMTFDYALGSFDLDFDGALSDALMLGHDYEHAIAVRALAGQARYIRAELGQASQAAYAAD